MQCRIFYAIKCCFSLLRMRSQVGLAPSAHCYLLQGLGAVASSGSTRGTQATRPPARKGEREKGRSSNFENTRLYNIYKWQLKGHIYVKGLCDIDLASSILKFEAFFVYDDRGSLFLPLSLGPKRTSRVI